MVKIDKIYNKFIPIIIEWFLKKYCNSEFCEDKVYLKRLLDEYDKAYSSYKNGEKEFIIERKYLYSLKEAVLQAISDEYIKDDLLCEFGEFLNNEHMIGGKING